MSNLNSKKNKKNFFLILIAFFILSTIELILFIPRVNKSINQSGIKEILSQNNASSITNEKELLSIYYIDFDDNPVKYTINSYITYDKLHDTFEYLIGTPPINVLKQFYINYIPSQTKLIGVTQTENAIYVNYSKEILQSKNMNLCFKQIEATVKSLNNNAKLILLIDSEIYNS